MHTPKINLITGGAGFLGSNLIDRLLEKGEKVICIDNFFSGRRENISKWEGDSSFKFIEHDVIKPIDIEADKIWHLACPGSPKIHKNNEIEVSRINFLGTYNMLEIARRNNAKFLMASTSEIYGKPEIHPQKENYNGSVKSTGVRSCYTEGKRFAESLCFDFKRVFGCDIKLARIFNTYGPRMFINDGRVISNFIVQSLLRQPLTIYGKGNQTRSFCYVDDLIDGLVSLMNSKFSGPVNLGNPEEISILRLADLITSKINYSNIYLTKNPREDDPSRRKPAINLAKEELGWEPKVSLNIGLDKTISYFKKELKLTNQIS
tara:strand:+ start:63 stop:1019 length:957 start_codon:yes stop_codon:yes gene_type:complete